MSNYKVSLNAIIWVVVSIFALTMSVLYLLLKGGTIYGNPQVPMIFAAFTMPVFLAFKKIWLNAAIFGVLSAAFFAFVKYRDSLDPFWEISVLAESYSFILLNLIVIIIYLVKYLKANVKITVKGQNDR